MCNSGHAVGRLRRQSNVTSTRIVLADYLGRPRTLLTVRMPPACDVNGVFAAMHSPGRTECPTWKGTPKVQCAIVL